MLNNGPCAALHLPQAIAVTAISHLLGPKVAIPLLRPFHVADPTEVDRPRCNAAPPLALVFDCAVTFSRFIHSRRQWMLAPVSRHTHIKLRIAAVDTVFTHRGQVPKTCQGVYLGQQNG